MFNRRNRLSRLALAGLLIAPLAIAKPGSKGIEVELLGTYSQPDPAAAFDKSASEIVAFDKNSERLFVTNGADKTLDILSISDPSAPSLVGSINVADNPDFGAFVGGGANSVAVARGIVAAAVEADTVTDPGAVAFFDTDGNFLGLVSVGALPDMLTFTDNGKTLLVANEGEPNAGIDPEGSISIIDIKKGVAKAVVTTASFNAFDHSSEALRAAGVRLFPDVANGKITVSQDLEPEYIAVDSKGKTAMVTLQEANALAVVDIKKAMIVEILPLGTKDHSVAGAGLDPSDKDGGIAIGQWPVRGLYMPDTIASYKVKGATYYITANEGDDRGDADEEGRGDAIRFKDIQEVISFDRRGLAPSDALAAAGLDGNAELGRLNISSIDGIDENGYLNTLYAYGARSFTIWSDQGELVWDSGDLLEQITAQAYPEYFNVSNDANRDEDTDSKPAIDNRSDNKGPEPEAVTVAKIKGRHYAFVGLERFGGFAVFDVSKPEQPEFITYESNRNFSASNAEIALGEGDDLGPESLLFIDKKDSPDKDALLVVANEVSGTTSVYRILNSKKSKK